MPVELNICLKTFGLMAIQWRLLNKRPSSESTQSRVLHKAEIIMIIPVPGTQLYYRVYLYPDI